MRSAQSRVISVRHGGIRPAGSWLYVWIDTTDGSITYVGGTGFYPELRAYLHLTSQNPDHGQVRATVPDYQTRDFDVLSFALPEDVPRDQAKKLLIATLGEEHNIESEDVGNDPLRSVIGPIVDAVEDYVRTLRSVATEGSRSVQRPPSVPIADTLASCAGFGEIGLVFCGFMWEARAVRNFGRGCACTTSCSTGTPKCCSTTPSSTDAMTRRSTSSSAVSVTSA